MVASLNLLWRILSEIEATPWLNVRNVAKAQCSAIAAATPCGRPGTSLNPICSGLRCTKTACSPVRRCVQSASRRCRKSNFGHRRTDKPGNQPAFYFPPTARRRASRLCWTLACWLKTLLPAMSTFAPASTTVGAVFVLTPPSTSKVISRPVWAIMSRN